MTRALALVIRSAAILLVVSLAMFLLLFVGPNPLEQLRENPEYTPADIERLTEAYGWDRPVHEQYLDWLGGALRGDLGESMVTRRPAWDMVAERLPLTLAIAGTAELLSLLIAIPLGSWLAMRRDSRVDRGAAFASFTLMATPGFLFALALQLAAVKAYHATGQLVLPTAGPPLDGGLLQHARHLVLPVLALVVAQVASWNRIQRAEMMVALESEYVTTARAKGLPERRISAMHAFPNTTLPLVTIVAMDVGGLLGGAIVVESIFGLPGTGMLLLEAVGSRDVVVVLALVVLGSALIVAANAIADLVYGVVDPRVKAAGG